MGNLFIENIRDFLIYCIAVVGGILVISLYDPGQISIGLLVFLFLLYFLIRIGIKSYLILDQEDTINLSTIIIFMFLFIVLRSFLVAQNDTSQVLVSVFISLFFVTMYLLIRVVISLRNKIAYIKNIKYLFELKKYYEDYNVRKIIIYILHGGFLYYIIIDYYLKKKCISLCGVALF